METDFRELVEYAHSKGNVFKSYQEAHEAFLKHLNRISTDEKDPLFNFFCFYHAKLEERYGKRYRNRFKDYHIYQIVDFLKAHGWYNMQLFNSPANEHTDLVYSEDGVQIQVNEFYEYADILGMDEADFVRTFGPKENKRYDTMGFDWNIFD